MKLTVPVLLCVFALALAAAIVVWRQHEDDPAFVLAQQQLRRLPQAEVEKTLAEAPDPSTGKQVADAKASCRPGGRDELRNPWRCRITYKSGEKPRYDVTIQPDGAYRGERRDDIGEITGCCVRVSIEG